MMGAGVERPMPSDSTRRAADELVHDLLEALPVDEGGRRDAIRFEGAVDALQAVGAASGEWYERRAGRMGWSTADDADAGLLRDRPGPRGNQRQSASSLLTALTQDTT
jgi:hypothetical protein